MNDTLQLQPPHVATESGGSTSINELESSPSKGSDELSARFQFLRDALNASKPLPKEQARPACAHACVCEVCVCVCAMWVCNVRDYKNLWELGYEQPQQGGGK